MLCPQQSPPATTGPHRALVCYDILFNVFEQLAAHEDAWYDYDVSTRDAYSWYARKVDSQRRTTLARCARVCRAFLGPAIAILWRDVDSLSPLISAIRASDPSSSNIVRIPRLGTRAFEYARRVRAVHGFGKPLDSRDSASLDGLPPPNDLPLLPQLRHLRWVQLVPSGMELLQIIPGSLRSLHIVFRRSPAWQDLVAIHDTPCEYEVFVRELLKEISLKAPHLRYLRISTSGDVKESWLESIGDFPQVNTIDVLERVHCPVLTTRLILPLSSLRDLRHLRIRLPNEIPSLAALDPFPSLQSLTLDAMFAPIRVVSAFLSAITSPQLHTVVIQNCECTTMSVGMKVHEVCDVMRSRFSSSLRKVELSLRGIGPIITDTHPLIRTIEPLLDMHDLDDVCLTIAPEVAVIPASEHDLEKMAEAWPKATRLHLCYHPSSSSPSLKDIAEFARQCGDLTDLVLPGIDATASYSDGDLQNPTTINPHPKRMSFSPDPRTNRDPARHALRTLSLADSGWNSKIPDPVRLARFMDELFPEVEWKCPPLASEHWRETIQEIVRLRIARITRLGL
ncbi:hypothetical protein L226DRAFT_465638 [Lentinus tigrinus ALCF2SS1-7]|uniref:F-box domain-containing protein n=1 Tax=Lentinus tigrinus ALCF2SS1-6 TaxID=1328759 RepID=A0A5C2S6U8_9APHY|nr:hypothetical protein L227DRAFT_504281 [Lentinus tigrinus ALCF2SS1-6]RPD73296.1 hypothetical protein L226DRAFT_465638 [Lentinus tigrinus ALCF2SS1-7]